MEQIICARCSEEKKTKQKNHRLSAVATHQISSSVTHSQTWSNETHIFSVSLLILMATNPTHQLWAPPTAAAGFGPDTTPL